MHYVKVLLIFMAPAMVLASQNSLVSSTVAIYTRFAHAPSTLSVEQMKAELDAIMAPSDLHLDWRDMEQTGNRQPTAELMVVSFKGECQADWLTPTASHDSALGWTHISDGQLLPFTDVDCDRIRHLMRQPLSLAPPPERAKMLGRAMARVLAHELYHYLLHTTRHASSGLAKASYTASELASVYLRFADTQVLLLRQQGPHPLPDAGAPDGE